MLVSAVVVPSGPNHVQFFLSRCMIFKAATMSEHSIRLLWLTFDIPLDKLDVFVQVNPRWNGTHLEVDESVRDDPDVGKHD